MVRRALVLSAIAMMFGGAIVLALSIVKREDEAGFSTSASLPDPVATQGKRTIFLSGHSLTDQPMPNFMADIADAAGNPIVWNSQHSVGSSIKDRSFGHDASRPWSGFATGTDSAGKPVDVIQELQAPSIPDANAYDILLITEQHRLLDSLLWQGTTTYLRAYQDRFIASSPAGQTFFLTPWLDLSDKDDLNDWIAYERAAWPVWQCTIAKVNHGIAADGRHDSIHMIPASLALAALMEDLTGKPGQSGFETWTARQMTDAIFSDTVHLTPLGSYFTAAVAYSSIYGTPPVAEVPSSLNAAQAITLRDFAATFTDRYRKEIAASDGKPCASSPPLSFVIRYTRYVDQTYTRPEKGYLLSKLQQIRDTLRFAWSL